MPKTNLRKYDPARYARPITANLATPDFLVCSFCGCSYGPHVRLLPVIASPRPRYETICLTCSKREGIA